MTTMRWVWPLLLGVVACSSGGAGDDEPSGTGGLATIQPTSEPGATSSESAASSSTATGDSSSSLGSSTDGGSSTTGSDPHVWSIDAARITDQNRHYVEMHGGWGPHLRGIMRDSGDGLWFVHDAGEDVIHNRSVHYVRHQGDAWEPAGMQPLTSGVQQNAASLLHEDVIHTWAVDVVEHRLVHCSFDTATAVAGGCAAVEIGGPYLTPDASNYVGAALSPDPAHLVWFTVVGNAGGAGSFVYTYDYGGGYNGPVVTPLPGYNDLAYVFAAFTGPSAAMLVGQAYAGVYPNGTYGALTIEFAFGQPATFTALFIDGAPVRSAADVWIDPTSGTAHVLAETDDNRLAYYAKPSDEAWSAHAEPTFVFTDSFRGRFVAPSSGELAVVRGSASDGGIEILIATPPADGLPAAIDWAAAERVVVGRKLGARLGVGFEQPSALYVEGSSYQDQPVGALQFAACGRYQVQDGEIWQLVLSR